MTHNEETEISLLVRTTIYIPSEVRRNILLLVCARVKLFRVFVRNVSIYPTRRITATGEFLSRISGREREEEEGQPGGGKILRFATVKTRNVCGVVAGSNGGRRDRWRGGDEGWSHESADKTLRVKFGTS